MKNLPPLRQTLCKNYCSYYKPGKNEALACRGYTVVEGLLARGKSLPFGDPGVEFDRTGAASLVEKLCDRCDFQKDGCDFVLDRTSPPCGGFVLLARLIARGVVTVDELA